ncbi:hypothetical protein CXG81DRAFT_28569 [Caulochytrium protostelioides]|uniref:Uncharacterized protein n=1 Tax=Caulochytrium protostelioides TaxID=1555241 RepID=A0A4V1ITX9_9FUNG|nr:hypothetical protein CXG81DRAFT_28569 [Caulochytrium protostelioides]|eukprot:RKO98617.1 hypothetical protein CXG81DRAFT_28569 [Caulochytrium protostelioides]
MSFWNPFRRRAAAAAAELTRHSPFGPLAHHVEAAHDAWISYAQVCTYQHGATTLHLLGVPALTQAPSSVAGGLQPETPAPAAAPAAASLASLCAPGSFADVFRQGTPFDRVLLGTPDLSAAAARAYADLLASPQWPAPTPLPPAERAAHADALAAALAAATGTSAAAPPVADWAAACAETGLPPLAGIAAVAAWCATHRLPLTSLPPPPADLSVYADRDRAADTAHACEILDRAATAPPPPMPHTASGGADSAFVLRTKAWLASSATDPARREAAAASPLAGGSRVAQAPALSHALRALYEENGIDMFEFRGMRASTVWTETRLQTALLGPIATHEYHRLLREHAGPCGDAALEAMVQRKRLLARHVVAELGHHVASAPVPETILVVAEQNDIPYLENELESQFYAD